MAVGAADVFERSDVHLRNILPVDPLDLGEDALFGAFILSDVGVAIDVHAGLERQRLDLAQQVGVAVAAGEGAVCRRDDVGLLFFLHFMADRGKMLISVGIDLAAPAYAVVGGAPGIVMRDVITEEVDGKIAKGDPEPGVLAVLGRVPAGMLLHHFVEGHLEVTDAVTIAVFRIVIVMIAGGVAQGHAQGAEGILLQFGHFIESVQIPVLGGIAQIPEHLGGLAKPRLLSGRALL